MLTLILPIVLALASFQDPAAETPGPQSPGPLMWTGKMLAGEGKEPAKDNAGRFAGDLRRRLDELRTRTELKRDFAEQLVELDTLRVLADWWFDYEGKADLAADIAVVRADWLEKLGRHEQAVFAAWHPFVMHEEYDSAPYNQFVLVPSEGKLAELLGKIDALPATVELRKRFPAGVASKKAEDPIEEAVRAAFASGNASSIIDLKNFGTRCVPALVKALGETPYIERFSNSPGVQPLTVLLQLDRQRGYAFILDTLGKLGPLWTMRVIQSLVFVGSSGNDWAPDPDPFKPPHYSDEMGLRVLEALTQQDMPALGLVRLLGPLVRNDVVTPRIQEFLLTLRDTRDPDVLSALYEMCDGSAAGPRKHALYAAFLEAADPSLRARAATALVYYPADAATLRAATSQDSNVRVHAPMALVTHSVSRYAYSRTGEPSGQRIVVERTPEIEAALEKLARDPESSVRLALVQTLQASGEVPAGALLEALLTDADPKVRTQVAQWPAVDPDLNARILERLAGDSEPVVLDTVGGALWNLAGRPRRSEDLQAYLPALAKLLANPKLDPKQLRQRRDFLSAALRDSKGAQVVYDGCTSGPNAKDLGVLLLDCVSWKARNSDDIPIYRALDAGRMTGLVKSLCANYPDPGLNRALDDLGTAVRSGEADAAPFLAVLRDESQPRETRLRAFEVGCIRASAEDLAALQGILRGVRPEELSLRNPGASQLEGLLLGSINHCPVDALRGFAASVLVDDRIADVPALRAAAMALDTTQEKLDAKLTARALERWNRTPEEQQARAAFIFQFLDPATDPAVVEAWQHAASSTSLGLGESLLNAIGRYPVDESVPILARYVTRKDIDAVSRLHAIAVGLLATRLDELAADALLKAVTDAPTEEVRKKCFDGLAQIRQYQDEKQLWEKRKGGEAAREQAIADLLPMLSDKDATTRAAAARSLATLKAVEHLPKLVALLKDKDATVREAAQKALDALNAPEPAKKP